MVCALSYPNGMSLVFPALILVVERIVSLIAIASEILE